MRGQREYRSKKIILGLTGSFGSGKTTVAKIFRDLGAKTIDADRIAHSLIKPKTKIYKKIINIFGKDILKKNRTIDRRKLAKLVFSNKKSLKKLNRIMHPEIIRIIKEKIKNTFAKVIVLDAPLLLEAGLKSLVDKLVVVDIRKPIQIKRIQNKTHQNRIDILKRLKFQIPLAQKIRMADFVIDNSQTFENTKKQVEKIRRLLWKN